MSTISEQGGTGRLTDAADTAPVPRDPLAALWSPVTIRARCAAIAQAVSDGRSGWFTLDRTQLPELARRVAELTRRRFPDLRVPLHSRWRHFEAGGVDRAAELEAALAGRDRLEAARARIDLTVISVLLDAGAGPDWRYDESKAAHVDPLALPAHRQRRDELLAMLDRASGQAAGPPAHEDGTPDAAAPAASAQRWGRSEGLAIATFRAFMGGTFSQAEDDPLRVDARVLTRLDAAALRAVFQGGPSNPLTGLEGRAELLRRLGAVLEASAAVPGRLPRPCDLFDRWLLDDAPVHAGELLSLLAAAWAPIWLSGSRVLGLPAGDVWPHAWAASESSQGADRPTGGWVPFHKLTQWLVYSLVEPLQAAGLQVIGLESLTGLPEYRNGGLLLDGGVIVPRDPRDLARSWPVGHEWVVEWRALTVHLLDELAVQVREQLGLDAEQLPLAAVLEGGTWAAGRELAHSLRGGPPPVRIESDGTVF
jgi:Protein of unknown function (DUF1688)